MTDAALRPAPASPLAWALDAPVPLVLLAWALFVAMSRVPWAGIGVTFGDTDDAMRLVEIRDFLAGQSWFDLHQYRFDPPSPAPMHWSRLVDLPQAGLMSLFGLVLSADTAEKLAMFVWPPLTFLPVLFAARRLAVALGGRFAALPGVLLTVWLLAATWQFVPGRIDHHNVQIALTLGLLVAVAAGGVAGAAWAALLSALMMQVGMETLPYVLIVAAATGLGFVLDPARARAMCVYGLALAGATTLLYVLTVPPDRYAVAACDALSSSYVGLAVAGGLALALVTHIEAVLASPARRAGAVMACGALALAVFGAIEPACLRGPFAQVDPGIRAIWLDRVQEVQPITVSFRENAAAAIVTLVMPVLGLFAGASLLRSGDGRTRLLALTVLLCCLAALAIGCVQIRTLVYANILGVPLVAGLIGRVGGAAEREGRSPVLTVVAGSVLCSTLAAIVVLSIIPGLSSASTDDTDKQVNAYRASCFSTEGYQPLGAEPAGLVAGFVDSGPFILAGTHHSVLSAPYHRMARGIRDSYDLFAAPPEGALAIARRRGVDYLAFCTSSTYVAHFRDDMPDSLAARLVRGDSPDWLEPIGQPGGPIRAYRVKKG